MNKQLIKHVQIKFGRSIKFQRDIKELKDDIYFVTGEIIGFNTLRRAFGLLKQVDPSSKTLKVLSNYVGFRTYNKFLNKDKKDILWKNWNYLNKFLKKSDFIESDFNWLIDIKDKDYYYLFISRIINDFFIRNTYNNLLIFFNCKELFDNNKRQVTAKITTTLNNEISHLNDNELENIYFLLKNPVFRDLSLYSWVEMDNSKSYYGSFLFESKKYIENEDEILFTNLYLLLLDFLEKKQVVFPFKLAIPENCHPILLGRYWSIQMICQTKKRTDILNNILTIAKKIDSKNEFFQEIIPVLILLKDVYSIEIIMNDFYEDLMDYQRWDHISIERYNLMALALTYIKQNNYSSIDQLFEFFKFEEEFHHNNNYQKLFYSIALYHYRKASFQKKELLDEAENIYVNYSKKLGFKYFDKDFLISYFD